MSRGPAVGAGDRTSGPARDDPEPLDDANQPPSDRYCDLVLTGGVTDGVVYPWAIVELARAYRFKNIGGTSVGAMAAALTAAAEYARRQGYLSGFNDVVLQFPRKLGEDVKGRTRLFTLFQPAQSTRRLFDLFVAFFSSTTASAPGTATPSLAVTVRRAIPLVLRTYRWSAWCGLAAGLLAGIIARMDGGGGPFSFLLTWLSSGLVFMVLCLVRAIYRDVTRGLIPNGFGICTGGHVPGDRDDEQSLIEWLHEGIQLAARKPVDQPLTFKDLWDAPGGPKRPRVPAARQTRKPRSIDLRVITTSLAHRRPYLLPLDDETSPLFFTIEDLAPYFPQAVLEHLKCHAKKYPQPGPDGQQIYELPKGELPVVVAARLSLSYPVLFSAVPLWAIDHQPGRQDAALRRCYFSDGGICSNFPIHLFDAAIPGWPTFGIWVGTQEDVPRGWVWLPRRHYEGMWDGWDRFGDNKSPAARLLGFFRSILYSAKDWDDATAMRMPGVRDRVVRVYLPVGGSALNLKLTRNTIMDLARHYGRPAGKALVDKFIAPTGGAAVSAAWDEHRWVRLNTFLVGLRERIEGITAASELSGDGTPLSTQIAVATSKPPLSGSDPSGAALTPLQAGDLRNLLAALEELESEFAESASPQPYKPMPAPTLHIRPPL
jgi:predicted acylesterase/phospholipase RssA